jgi:hypothetical protein
MQYLWAASCGHGVGFHVEQSLDIEHDKKLIFQAMDARGDPRQTTVEISRYRLAPVIIEPQHLADGIDHEPIRFAIAIDADCHRFLAVFPLCQTETAAHVDRGDDPAAQIQYAGDLLRSKRHFRHLAGNEYIVHLPDRQPEELATDCHCDVFIDAVVFVFTARAHGSGRPIDVIGLFFQRRDQSLSIELGDEIMDASLPNTRYVLRGRHR